MNPNKVPGSAESSEGSEGSDSGKGRTIGNLTGKFRQELNRFSDEDRADMAARPVAGKDVGPQALFSDGVDGGTSRVNIGGSRYADDADGNSDFSVSALPLKNAKKEEKKQADDYFDDGSMYG